LIIEYDRFDSYSLWDIQQIIKENQRSELSFFAMLESIQSNRCDLEEEIEKDESLKLLGFIFEYLILLGNELHISLNDIAEKAISQRKAIAEEYDVQMQFASEVERSNNF
jgi:hypothetical protein